ncbi:MAG: indolepyruvate oxidoreductase subunit beta [Armatimonadota bacterium]
MITNVLLTGVGGQGTITASQVLAEACLLQGWQIKKSEIHGMSQRGGSVESHVRFSPDSIVYSPTIPDGEVDVLLGFELLEALRGLPQVKPEGTVIVDPRRIVPITVALGGPAYPDDALEQMQHSGRRVIVVPAFEEAEKLGEVRAANIVLLGAAAAVLNLKRDVMEEAIKLVVKAKAVEVNVVAFARGAELAG